MSKFKFQFESVWVQRRAQEEKCQRHLAKVLRQRMILRDQLRQMQQTITQSKQDLTEGLTGTVDLAGVSGFARYSGQVTQRAHAFVTRLAVVEKQIDTARATLLEATHGRRAIELLRDKRRRLWQQQQDRREAAQLDEIAVQRHACYTALEAVE